MSKTGLDIKDLELNALLEITQAINNNLSEEDLFRIYKFTLLADLKVQTLALYVNDDTWRCRVHFGSNVIWENVTLPSRFRDFNNPMDLSGANDDFSAFDLAIPVFHKSRLLAVLFVGGGDKDYIRDDGTFLKALTNIIIVAIENKKLARRQLQQEAFRKEMEIAKKVQNYLFPKSLPNTKQLQIEAVYLPHQNVGGDYYDYLKIDDDRFLICVADVSGKGVPAALLMSNFQASFHTLIRKTQDLKEIVEELNMTILESSNGEYFITFFVALYDYKTETLEYVNCGHNPLYLHDGEQLAELNDGTTILGMFSPLPFLKTCKISQLSRFFLFGYTDGLTETFNQEGEQFGEDKLINILSEGIPSDIKIMHKSIFHALDDFRGEVNYNDDITMISCVVNGWS